MTGRIFRAILLVCMLTLLVTFGGVFIIFYQTYSSMEFSELEKQISLIASVMEETGDTYLPQLDDDSYRLNWIAADGTVLYDSIEDPVTMSNHLDRVEIQEAKENGIGTTTRFSSTLSEENYYIAQQLSDGSFIRLSVTMTSIYGFLSRTFFPFLLLIAAAVILSLILAQQLSRSIVKPILAIDLDHPLETKTYPQLRPLLERIEDSNLQISRQMEQLQMKSREFEAVANNMDEGLLLLSEKQQMLSSNEAARKIFHITDAEDWSVDSIKNLPEAMEKADRQGRATFPLRQNHRDYVVEVACIKEKSIHQGYVILILDTTEKVEAQKRRQEFTANVTHELKTPIQTIMSSTELLQAGLVKKEDQERFLKYISKESSRLVAMIDDIIQLSRLDSGYEETEENLQLDAIVQEIVVNNAQAAATRNITINVDMEPVCVQGAVKTWQEIFSNLIENAIKYNKENGTIDIRLKENRQSNEVFFEVRDTGIGIPEKYQERVFERFFRVDKSHSKTVGGTGLGLAIVYHAVQQLGGKITLKSKEGKGTRIFVRVPVSRTEPEAQASFESDQASVSENKQEV